MLGISAASTSLAQLTIREPVGSALDLGTGCGVQALHLAGHADRVVATDVNRRALEIARFNAELNELAPVEVRDGSYFEPVAGERFDPDRDEPAVRDLPGHRRAFGWSTATRACPGTASSSTSCARHLSI